MLATNGIKPLSSSLGQFAGSLTGDATAKNSNEKRQSDIAITLPCMECVVEGRGLTIHAKPEGEAWHR